MWWPCPTAGCDGETNFEDVECPQCCKVCKDFDISMMTVSFDDRRFESKFKQWREHLDTYHKRLSRSHAGNGTYKGPFAFTLTKSPTDDLTEEDMIKAVRKLMAQKSCPVKQYAWYLEYGDVENKTHPHIHGIYETETGGKIEKKHFKRAWPIWDPAVRCGAGFRGGYHREVMLNENYQSYIAKQSGTHDSHLLSVG